MMKIDYAYRCRLSWVMAGLIVALAVGAWAAFGVLRGGSVAVLGFTLGEDVARAGFWLGLMVSVLLAGVALTALALRIAGCQRVAVSLEGVHLPASCLSSESLLVPFASIESYQVVTRSGLRVIRLITKDRTHRLINVMLENDRVFGRLIGAFEHYVTRRGRQSVEV